MKNKHFPVKLFNNRKINTEAVDREIYVHNMCIKYGIPEGHFSSKETKDNYREDFEEEAYWKLLTGEELDDSLKKKLTETLPERTKRNELREKDIKDKLNKDMESAFSTEEGVEKLTGINFRKQTWNGINFKDILKLQKRKKNK